jgi:hypothetical protein
VVGWACPGPQVASLVWPMRVAGQPPKSHGAIPLPFPPFRKGALGFGAVGRPNMGRCPRVSPRRCGGQRMGGCGGHGQPPPPSCPPPLLHLYKERRPPSNTQKRIRNLEFSLRALWLAISLSLSTYTHHEAAPLLP